MQLKLMTWSLRGLLVCATHDLRSDVLWRVALLQLKHLLFVGPPARIGASAVSVDWQCKQYSKTNSSNSNSDNHHHSYNLKTGSADSACQSAVHADVLLWATAELTRHETNTCLCW